MNDYKEIIYSILHEANPYEEIEDTTELIESGIVDSLTLVFMVTQLEEMTDKKISEDLIVPENFYKKKKINETLNSIY